MYVEGRPPGDEGRRVSFLFVTPGFLPAMGIPLRAGRFLTEADTSEDVLFAVVNQAAVNRYWPDRNPIGVTGRLNRADGNQFQVVGVIGDIRNDGLNKTPEAELYLLASLIPDTAMTRPSPSVARDGYQRTCVMSPTRIHSSTAGSITQDDRRPMNGSYCCVPPAMSTLPSGSTVCPAQNTSNGVTGVWNVPA